MATARTWANAFPINAWGLAYGVAFNPRYSYIPCWALIINGDVTINYICAIVASNCIGTIYNRITASQGAFIDIITSGYPVTRISFRTAGTAVKLVRELVVTRYW
jgi:hypothetical protein